MSAKAQERVGGIFLKDAGGLPPRRDVENYYEGANWKYGERSMLWGTLQDARLDATAMARKELQRKSLYFDKNNAFQNRLADIFEQYTVGTGLPVVSKSVDATEYFGRWCKDSDSLGIQSFCGQQGIASRAWYVFGESFIVREVVNGRLKINIVEPHRCETPPKMASEEGKSIVDGVQIDGNGRVLGYWFNRGEVNGIIPHAQDDYEFVQKEDVIHVFEPSRARMYRGLPFVTPVINDMNDLDDLQMLTMQVAKQAALIGNVHITKTGELSTDSARRANLKINTPNASGTVAQKNSNIFYDVRLGSHEIAMAQGESVNQFQANRPSLVEQQHWDYLTTKICAGVGISKLLVIPYSMQGTVARSDLDIAAAFFRARSAVMQAAVEKVYMWVIEWAQDYDREVIRGGFNFADYEKVTVRAPRSVNVDIGRNSKAALEELASSARTYQDWYAEEGKDWREQFDKIKEAKEYAINNGIELPSAQKSAAPEQQKQGEPTE